MIVRVRAPSRLHFGLLALDPAVGRRFGGVGLMVDDPGLELTVRPAEGFTARGPLADRALEFARSFWAGRPAGAAVRIHRAPPQHAGLGTGTQLAMAVGRGLASITAETELGPRGLAERVGRGLRSAIGLHGFARGGFLVEAGKRPSQAVAPLVARLDFPTEWQWLLIIPRGRQGLSGPREQQAFRDLPAISETTTDRLCRIVLLGLMPTIVERDFSGFGSNLFELQRRVGECFAPVQGGVYASPTSAEIVRQLRSWGVAGVGQSSWGPTLFALIPDQPSADALAARVRERFGLSAGEVIRTQANNHGAEVSELAG